MILFVLISLKQNLHRYLGDLQYGRKTRFKDTWISWETRNSGVPNQSEPERNSYEKFLMVFYLPNQPLLCLPLDNCLSKSVWLCFCTGQEKYAVCGTLEKGKKMKTIQQINTFGFHDEWTISRKTSYGSFINIIEYSILTAIVIELVTAIQVKYWANPLFLWQGDK